MKIFISHSSNDYWIAKKIAADLEDVGAEAFLDTRDLLTGDEIDDKIRDKIIDSDELLVLVSQAALESHWILIEVGAAWVLKKRLVLILVNVAPNEIPQPINLHLTRDLNSIELYYDELRKRPTEASPENSTEALLTVPALDRQSNDRGGRFNVGDRVRVVAEPPEPEVWPTIQGDMRKYLGQETTIRSDGQYEHGTKTYRLNLDGGMFFWAERWLQGT